MIWHSLSRTVSFLVIPNRKPGSTRTECLKRCLPNINDRATTSANELS